MAAAPDSAHRAFEKQVERAPDAVAVESGRESITYAELERRANAFAAGLTASGARPGSVVALTMERSLDVVVGVLGALKSGAAWLAVDPDEQGAKTRLDALATRAAPRLHVSEISSLSRAGAPRPSIAVGADHPAYVACASGPRGPLAVVVPHRALAHGLAWMQRTYPLRTDDRVLFRTRHALAASLWEVLAPLAAGARVVVAPASADVDLRALTDFVRAAEITVVQLVPSVLESALDNSWLSGTALRRIVCSGEPLLSSVAARASAQTGAQVVSLHAPAEAAIAALHDASDGTKTITLGAPADDLEARVLSSDLRDAADGTGALYLAGASLATAYAGDPALTAARFVPDPFGPPGSRMFATGDVVRRLADGRLDHLRRDDGQVQIGGRRIDVGEIEAALRALPDVTEAVVLKREDTARSPRLVAYVVGLDSWQAEHAAQLRERLPDALMPSVIVPLRALPRTASGSVDHAALPAPETGDQLVEPPTTATEQLLATLWKQLLQLDALGVRDDFFDIGGHSLHVAQMIAFVQKELEVTLQQRTIFDAPTIAELAAVIDAARGVTPGASMREDS